MESKNEHRKGPWTVEEDRILMDHIRVHGKGKWNRIAKTTGIYICIYIDIYIYIYVVLYFYFHNRKVLETLEDLGLFVTSFVFLKNKNLVQV